jgi:hypothetical protein
MRKRAVEVEKTSPNMMVLAMGPQTTDFPLIPAAVVRRPAIVVRDVRRIGRSLVVPASTMASRTTFPFPGVR